MTSLAIAAGLVALVMLALLFMLGLTTHTHHRSLR